MIQDFRQWLQNRLRSRLIVAAIAITATPVANVGSDAPMSQASFANAQRFTARARALLAVIAEDVRTWDVFRWAVIVLFALNVFFLLSLTGDIRSEIAALSQEQSAGIDQ